MSVKIVLTAPRGKMGRTITRLAAAREDIILAGAVAAKGRDYVGQDLGRVAGLGYDLGILVTDDLEAALARCDVAVDFSTPENSLAVLQAACRHRKPLLCGTTGFSQEEKEILERAAEQIPLIYSDNTSKLVNVMSKALELVTRAVGETSDIEIIEMHDRFKPDAPSGTAKDMGALIAKTLGKNLTEIADYGRCGLSLRREGHIGYHSVRSGGISSTHTVLFGGLSERLEITHHAYNSESFAAGACDCAVFLYGKAPGHYTVEDVFEL